MTGSRIVYDYGFMFIYLSPRLITVAYTDINLFTGQPFVYSVKNVGIIGNSLAGAVNINI